MNLLTLIVVLVVVGVSLYMVESLIPMDYRIRRIIQAVICIAFIVYLLQAVGLLSGTHVH